MKRGRGDGRKSMMKRARHEMDMRAPKDKEGVHECWVELAAVHVS